LSIATLQDIILKVRRLTGSGNDFQLTDPMIIDYINSYYLYDFPAQYRSLKLKDKLTFNTIRGIDTYAFDQEHYSTVQAPCYCAKRDIPLFNDTWSFYTAWFNWQNQENFAQGNSTFGPYSGTVQATPIIRSVNNNPATTTQTTSTSPFPTNQPVFPNANFGRVQNILITANIGLGRTVNVTDDGNGNLIGDCSSGTIDYETGIISNLVFTGSLPIPSGADIQIQYNQAVLSPPLAILFSQNQFTVRPVPDRGYTIELTAYRLPSQALLGSDDPDVINYDGVPEQLEWWETLAFGAAKKIYQDRLDPDGISLMDAGLMEQLLLNETRTYALLGQRRIGTMFSDQLSYGYGSTGWGFPSGGS
jgi:hypothetical protein